MPIYNSKIQKQNEILSIVAQNIGYYHILSGCSMSLKEYNAELSRYMWTLNLVELRNAEA